MPDIQVGDRVTTTLPGFGRGVVRFIWGGLASVEFANRSKHIPLSDLIPEDSTARALRESHEAEERRRHEAEKQELARQIAVRKETALATLRSAMVDDFLSVDDLFNSKYSDDVDRLKFIEAKSFFARDWVDHNVGRIGAGVNPPDLEQAAAISSVNGNVQVVARAGSGKTTTLVNRSMFLIKHCKVAPNELLLLAFNRKAAVEIRRSLLLRMVPEAAEEIQREVDKARKHSGARRHSKIDVESQAVETIAERFVGRLPHVMTFHALAHAIVHPQGQILFDGNDEDSLGLSREIQGVINEFMQRPRSLARVQRLMMDHFRKDWDRIVAGGFHLSKEDLLALKRSLPRETLGGELVKSHGEKVIANFLFEHGIEYKYERNHWWSGVNYKPDFTIFTEPKAKAGVVIEYFGMFGDPKYDSQIEEKKKYWSNKKGWSLLSLYPKDIETGVDMSFEQTLLAELESRGIVCRRLSEEEIWKRVSYRAIGKFTRAATSFIGRCRKKSWSPEDLVKHVHAHAAATESESEFIRLVCEIFEAYLHRLDECGNDDFDGLMQKAAQEIESGRTYFQRKGGGGDIKALRFICIDEFQDFSELFHRLVNAIRKANAGLSMFCVGDDWQAINGFAGSELRFFENFPNYFGDATKLNISTNYRSSRQIVEIGNDLMAGLGSPARAYKSSLGNVWVCDMSKFEPTLIEKQRHPGDAITPLAARLAHRFALDGKKVVFLSRRNGLPWFYNSGDKVDVGSNELEKFLANVKACLPDDMRGMVSISTAHKYKGLEKSAVVVLDAVDRSYPLIHPDWPFFRIFGDSPQSLTDADRRLFYVALTRAVESLVIVTDSSAMSPFLDKIAERRSVAKLPWVSFPPVADGGNRRLLLKIKNAASRTFGDHSGTYPIRGVLLENRYHFHGVAKLWERSIAFNQFDLEAIQKESWAKKACEVEAAFYDDQDKLLATYKVDYGNWITVVDNWHSMSVLPFASDTISTASQSSAAPPSRA